MTVSTIQTHTHGGQGVEWLTESEDKISEIFLKLTDTAEIQCFVAPIQIATSLQGYVNKIMKYL